MGGIVLKGLIQTTAIVLVVAFSGCTETGEADGSRGAAMRALSEEEMRSFIADSPAKEIQVVAFYPRCMRNVSSPLTIQAAVKGNVIGGEFDLRMTRTAASSVAMTQSLFELRPAHFQPYEKLRALHSTATAIGLGALIRGDVDECSSSEGDLAIVIRNRRTAVRMAEIIIQWDYFWELGQSLQGLTSSAKN